ncbi:MAG: hypothetical protein ACK58L_22540 [Planctomycetota bacterium]
MMKNVLISLSAALLLSGIAYPQDKSPLDMIPETSVGVVRFDAPETIKSDLSAFINQVQPGFGGFVEANFATVLQQLSQNPTLDGLDLERDWYVAFVLNDDNEPQPVLILPTTAMDDARESVESVFETAENDDWLICAQDAAFLQDFASKEVSGISAIMDDSSVARISSGHIGLFINGEQLREDFAEELASADEELENVIEQIVAQAQQLNDGANLEAVSMIYRKMGQAVLQAVRDCEAIALSVEFTDNAFVADFRMTADETTETSKFFASHPASDLRLMTSLPEGQLGYFGFHGDPSVILTASRELLENLIENDDAKSRMIEAMDSMKDADFGEMTGAINVLPEEDVALRYLVISEVSPESAVRAAMESLGTGLEYETAGIKVSQTFEKGAEELDGTPVDIFKTQQTYPEELDPTGMQEAIQKKMYGPDGIVQRILMKNGRMYQTLGGDLETLKSLVSASSSWQNSVLLTARAELHEQANTVILVDMPNTTIQLLRTVASTNALPVPLPAERFESLKLPPSYSGFSMILGRNSLETRGTIPIDTIQGFIKFGQVMQGMQNQ